MLSSASLEPCEYLRRLILASEALGEVEAPLFVPHNRGSDPWMCRGWWYWLTWSSCVCPSINGHKHRPQKQGVRHPQEGSGTDVDTTIYQGCSACVHIRITYYHHLS